MTNAGSCAIAVMAKAPQPGRVKTRLVPPLTHETAVAMSMSFLRDITDNIQLAARQERISGYVAFAPAESETKFDGMLAPRTGLVLADGSEDFPPRVHGFGRCLLHAARALFARGHDSVCLLNSDSPTLPTELLCRMAAALAEDGDRVVLGPADDGGYYLIGMKAPHAALFEDIAWSTEAVADQTRVRARRIGLPVFELAPWYDVDDIRGLRRLVHDLSSSNDALNPLSLYAAPKTADCIERLGLRDLLNTVAPR
jgi:hypothetical protein